ncbi:unnamed protein product [Meganyctiphanes norvegica]|uniref:C-type lectin domain-containing protein n=1 Tax=Meganyctiphanes norvegica TaxID=48144 RepID=A0AAV2SKV5_MEGNR
MSVIILFILLVPGVWAEWLPVNIQENNSIVANQRELASVFNVSSGCDQPFEYISNGCYFFSEIQMNFTDASRYCQGLAHGHTFEMTLAMLDYSRIEDQALLDAVTEKNQTFWVGGKTEDGIYWKWLDDRDVYLKAPFWRYGEPDEPDNNCIVAHVSNYTAQRKRSYLFDHFCGDSLHFICKTGNINCPRDFKLFGNHCYMISEDIGVPHLLWQEARDYCMSLAVHEGYHADLAVLGLEDLDEYHLMNNLIANYGGATWIGAFRDTEECNYMWVDGRELSLDSMYWQYDDPDCGNENRVYIYHPPSPDRPYLEDNPDGNYNPFICQMFTNI